MAKPKREMVTGLSAGDCVRALRTRYPTNAFALLEQVANCTGFGAGRWADVVVMSLWPSRGLTVSGFEIKVSRSDWKRELDDPAKSAEIQSYCDEWWIVAPRGMIDPHELPPTWGLLEVDENGGCKAKKTAPALEPKPLSRAFIAAILRRASDNFDAILRRETDAALRKGAENGADGTARELKRAQEDYAKLTARVSEFEAASGVEITYAWDLGNVGEAVRILRARRASSEASELAAAAARYERLAADLRRDADTLNAAQAPTAALRIAGAQ